MPDGSAATFTHFIGVQRSLRLNPRRSFTINRFTDGFTAGRHPWHLSRSGFIGFQIEVQLQRQLILRIPPVRRYSITEVELKTGVG